MDSVAGRSLEVATNYQFEYCASDSLLYLPPWRKKQRLLKIGMELTFLSFIED